MAATAVLKHGVVHELKQTAGSALNPGDVVVIGSRIGVVAGSKAIASGEEYTLQVSGVFEMPVLSTDEPALGAMLYWDAGNTRLTTTASTHNTAGIAIKAKASGVARMEIDLNASVASLVKADT